MHESEILENIITCMVTANPKDGRLETGNRKNGKTEFGIIENGDRRNSLYVQQINIGKRNAVFKNVLLCFNRFLFF